MNSMRAFAILATLYPSVALADDHGGIYTGKYTHKEVMPLDQQGQKMVVGATSTGTNKNSGRVKFMDDAKVVWGGVVALDQGKGPEQGIITLTAQDGTAIASYKGTATTQMGKDGPMIHGQGTWEALSGTGAYENYTGKGTYTRTGTSQTDFNGEWKGSLTKGKSDPETTASPRR